MRRWALALGQPENGFDAPNDLEQFMADAVAKATACPHLKTGGSIEIAEAIEIGM